MKVVVGTLLGLAAILLLALQVDGTYLWLAGPPSRAELKVAGGFLVEAKDCNRSSHKSTLTVRTGNEPHAFSIPCPEPSELAALRADANQVVLVSFRTRVIALPFLDNEDVWDLWTPHTHLVVYEQLVARRQSTGWLSGLMLAATLILGWFVVRSDMRTARRKSSTRHPVVSE